VVVSTYQCQNQKIDFRIMKKFTQDTYLLFGYEACSIYRAHEQSNTDAKIDHVGVGEISNQIADEYFNLHVSNPTHENYATDLLDAYDGWEDYERIDKDLYEILNKKLNIKRNK